MPAVEDLGINPGYIATEKSFQFSTTEFAPPLLTSEFNSADMEPMSNSNIEDDGISYEAIVAVASGTSAVLVVVTSIFRGLGNYFERKNQKSYSKWCNRIAVVSSLGSSLLMKAKPAATTSHTNCVKPCKYGFFHLPIPRNIFISYLFPGIVLYYDNCTCHFVNTKFMTTVYLSSTYFR